MIDCPRVSPDLWRHRRQSCLCQEHFLSFVWSLWEHNWLNNYIKNKIGRKTVFFFLGKLFNRIYCWKIELKYIWLRSIKAKTKYCSSKQVVQVVYQLFNSFGFNKEFAPLFSQIKSEQTEEKMQIPLWFKINRVGWTKKWHLR